MRPIRFLSASLIAVAVWGADPQPATPAVPAGPIAQAQIADGSVLIEHWNRSIYAKLWNDPVCDPLRVKFTEAQSKATEELGLDPLAVVRDMRGAALRFDGITPVPNGVPIPKLVARADLGASAAALFKLITTHQTTAVPAQVPGAQEALAHDQVTLARFEQVLVLAAQVPFDQALAWKPTAPPADLHATLDLHALYEAIASLGVDTDALAEFAEVAKGSIDVQSELVPEGVHERFSTTHVEPGSKTIDLAVLKRLPANTMVAAAMGFDGKAWWAANRTKILTKVAKASGQPGDAAAELWLDQHLKDFGLTRSVADLVQGLDGTMLFAVTQGMPFPGVTIALPRSAPIDELVTALLTKVNIQPPADGASTALPIPNLPIPVQLARDAGHWLLTTDVMLGTQWPAGQSAGWAESPAGKAALAKAGDKPFLIGSSDTPTIIRTLIPLIQMTGVGSDNLEASQRQAALMALSKLAAMASTGWLVGRAEGDGAVVEDQGLVSFTSLMGMGALAAFVSRTEVTHPGANEAAVAAALKSQIFPAEIQFQGGCYVDQNGNGIGEFGLVDELAGVRPTGKIPAGSLKLLSEDFTDVHGGYHYFIYLPDSKDGTVEVPDVSTEARVANAGAAKAQEQRFVAYAWPANENQGDRQFAITQTGIVYVAPYAGGQPAWNALFNNGTWDTAPSWQEWKANAGVPEPVKVKIEDQPAADPTPIP